MMPFEGYVISSNEYKKNLLKNLNEIRKYKFLTYEELLGAVYGKVAKNAIFLLMKEYSMDMALAKEYIKYIPFATEEFYNDMKLDSLVSARNLLMKNGLLATDDLLLKAMERYPVTFTEKKEEPLFLKTVERLEKITDVHFLESDMIEYEPVVMEYKTMDDEITGVCNKIRNLHKNGISYNRIHLMGVTSSHMFLLERMKEFYGIPFDTEAGTNILHTDFAKSILELMKTKETFQDVLDESKESEFKKSFLSLLADYKITDKNPKECIDVIRDAFKHMSYSKDIYEDMVSTSPMDYVIDDDYVFLVGLNQGVLPKTYKDDGYLSDRLLERLGLPTSMLKNKREKDKLLHFMKHTKNLFASYALSSYDGALKPSDVIASLNLKVMEEMPEYGYSRSMDYLRMGKNISILDKTGERDSSLDELSVEGISYNTYDPSFKGIEKAHMQEKFTKESPLSLSYSSAKVYFSCPFEFYADRILGLNTYESTTATRIGTFCHAVLEDSYKEDFDFETSISKNKTEGLKDLDPEDFARDEFYFNQMKDVLSTLISFNREKESKAVFDTVEREREINVTLGDAASFKGFIDKLMYKEMNGEIYAVIIDYKTGKDKPSLDNVRDGFNMQLPSYMYLLRHYEPFMGKVIHVIGIYLQKVNKISLTNDTPKEDQLRKSFMLQGFSICDKNLLSLLDPDYDASDYIAQMKTIKDGSFGKYTRVISASDEDELVSIIEKNIDDVIKGVFDCDFRIEPKKIKGVDKSCTFCKYKDICFKRPKDYKYIQEDEFPRKEEK